MKKFYTIAILLNFIISPSIFAQCLLKHSTLENRIESAEFVCEGEVIDQHCFWGKDSLMIYTANEIKLYKTFKGGTISTTMTLVTTGGTMGDYKIVAAPGLKLRVGQTGIFLIQNYYGSQFNVGANPMGWPVAEDASFLSYGASNAYAKDVFEDEEIERYDLYGRIEAMTGEVMVEIEELPMPNTQAGTIAPLITGLSPLTVRAGVEEVLTITGSGFGSTQGSVFFDSPNDGNGGAYTSTIPFHIQSWTDNEITVYVPSGAGTGRVFVRTSTGNDSSLSPQNLTVEYNVSNVNSGGNALRTYLIDDACDGDGGYQLVYSTNTANGGVNFTTAAGGQAAGAFERALDSWQANGYAAFAGDGCGVTSVQTPGNDGINIVSFDSNVWDLDNEASPSTLGVAYSQFSKCGSSEWEVIGMDIIFRRNGQGVTWEFGGNNGETQPSGGELDFETVALHEIGHTHQLGHVIDPGAVMHYVISAGTTNRTLGSEDMNGASDVESASLNYNPPIINCGGDFNCNRDYQTYELANDCALQVLPVEFTDFNGIEKDGTAQLTWMTASEFDNESFILERSIDGENFEEIARVQGAGYSDVPNDYHWTDRNPQSGLNYYRLSQRDFTGEQTYFEKLVVLTFKFGFDAKVMPNPVVNGHLTVDISSAQSGEIDLAVFNAAGQLVFNNVYGINDGKTYLRPDLPDLGKGVYFIQLKQNQNLKTIRFVVTDRK